MSIWRPSKTIKVKALGLVWRGDALLASEIPDDKGNVKGIRPLGGTVEFGENWQDALKREILEELGAEVTLSGPPIVLENIYSHHGVTGHEIIFLSNISFVDEALYARNEILFSEDDGMIWKARWFKIDKLVKSGPELFPSGLLEKLLDRPVRKRDS